MKGDAPVFAVAGFEARRFDRANIAPAQAFLEKNSGYHLLAFGERPPGDEAARELVDLPPQIEPADAFFLGFWERDDLAGLAHVMRTWPVAGISHVGLFQIAEARQGSGFSGRAYLALEQWMRAEFRPRWLRLGVLAANVRALRFWSRQGYHETGRKAGVPYGRLRHDLIVMVKSIQGEDDAAYRRLASGGPIALEAPSGQVPAGDHLSCENSS